MISIINAPAPDLPDEPERPGCKHCAYFAKALTDYSGEYGVCTFGADFNSEGFLSGFEPTYGSHTCEEGCWI